MMVTVMSFFLMQVPASRSLSTFQTILASQGALFCGMNFPYGYPIQSRAMMSFHSGRLLDLAL
jgi:hypothetical protein